VIDENQELLFVRAATKCESSSRRADKKMCIRKTTKLTCILLNVHERVEVELMREDKI
jgi:hypothetical protein